MTITQDSPDHRLKASIEEELARPPAINAAHIGVAVDSGAVALSGDVASYPEKAAAVTAGHQIELTAALGDRALFGFPAVGGVRVGAAIRFVLIGRQMTMLGERSGCTTPPVRELSVLLEAAGFPTRISACSDDWLTAHAAFVVPMAFALYRDGTDPAVLAGDRRTLRVMIRATRQAFGTLRAAGDTEIPANLNLLYRWLPTPLVVAYWRRVLAGARGELWFAAHSRAAPAAVWRGSSTSSTRRSG